MKSNHDLLPELRRKLSNTSQEISELAGQVARLNRQHDRLVAVRIEILRKIEENDYYHPPPRPAV